MVICSLFKLNSKCFKFNLNSQPLIQWLSQKAAVIKILKLQNILYHYALKTKYDLSNCHDIVR